MFELIKNIFILVGNLLPKNLTSTSSHTSNTPYIDLTKFKKNHPIKKSSKIKLK